MTAPASNLASGADSGDRAKNLVFEVRATPLAATVARRALLAGNGVLPGRVCDDVVLLVTELVTNAVRHARARPDRPVRVELTRMARTVRVTVLDGGSGFSTEVPQLEPDESGGWGLLLVDRIADRWAITPTSGGTCAWFEIACEQ